MADGDPLRFKAFSFFIKSWVFLKTRKRCIHGDLSSIELETEPEEKIEGGAFEVYTRAIVMAECREFLQPQEAALLI